jgi:isopenicillin-N N-acyltransferase-like protein
MGEQFGEACRAEIQDFYARRVLNALDQAARFGGRQVTEAMLLELANRCVDRSRAYDALGFAELEGIAHGAGLSTAQVLAMNGLTDLRDVLAWGAVMPEIERMQLGGCTSVVALGDVTQSGTPVCGQTWDLATDNMPFVLMVRRSPSEGPRTVALTTVGCLTLIGMNEHGLCVGTTNIRTRDARPGVTYLSILHQAIQCETAGRAADETLRAYRAGGHYYWYVDAEGASTVECAAETAAGRSFVGGLAVHTNHCLQPGIRAVEADTPGASSHARQERMDALLAAKIGKLTPVDLQAFFADRKNGKDAICRHDFEGISTNGAMVMEPSTLTAWACHGPPDVAVWERFSL